MVKRYYGGLISSTKRTTSVGNFVSGIYNKNTHLQAKFADALPPYDLRDPYFKYTTLLLNGDPPSPTFVTDASTNSFPISVAGDTKPNNFNPYSAGYYSNYFDGTGDYLTPAPSGSAAFTLGTGDFTMEAWVYPNSGTSNGILHISDVAGGFKSSAYTNSVAIALHSSNAPIIWANNTSYIGTSNKLPFNTWTHIAMVRFSGVTKLYINGIIDTAIGTAGSITDTTNYAGTYIVCGAYYTSALAFIGYISNLRVVKGTAVYTGNFTPPAAPLTIAGSTSAASYSNTANVNITFPQANTSVLTCFGNRLKDDSTNNFTITKNGDTTVNAFHPFLTNNPYASTYFDGTGDYLTALSNAAFTFGTGDFTIEGWFYVNSFGANGFIPFDNRASSTSVPFNLGVTAAGLPYLYEGATAPTGSSGITLNTWAHIAWVRTSGVLKMFVNGISVYSAAYTTNLTGTNCTIGGGVGALAGYFLNGYMSDFRLVKGTAVYSGNFTPPTAPLTAIGSTSAASYSSTANVNITFPQANTSLLTCQNLQPTNNSMFLDKSNNSFVITRNGNSTQGTFSPYGSNWSNYFGSSSNYLTLPTATATAWGGFNGNITTIEFWAYLTTSATASGSTGWIIGTIAGVVSNGRWQLLIGGGAATAGAPSKVYWYWTIGSTSGTAVETTQVVPINQWTHIAIVTNATGSAGSHTATIYVDGVGQTFTGQDFSSQTFTYDRLRIGGDNDSFPGWIHGLRIVRAPTNIVGYSGSTITVPTAPLGVVANTLLLTCMTNGFKDLSNVTTTIGSGGAPLVQGFNPWGTSIDSSVNPKLYEAYTPSLNSGSAYFDGTGDYLSVPVNAAFAFGTGDFTWEAWLNISAATNNEFEIWESQTTGSFIIYKNSSGANNAICYRAYGSADNVIVATAAIPYNQWFHLAVSRTSGVIKSFLNGVLTGTFSDATNFVSPSAIYTIGGRNGGTNPIPAGYISDLRIVKGTAVYTGNFTPPVRTLLSYGTSTTYSNTANVNTTFSVGNTALLCNFTNAAIYDATMTVNLETLADARVSTANSKFGGSAMYFDGTGDYLAIPSTPAFVFGKGDFTIECWVYVQTSVANNGIFHLTTSVWPSAVSGVALSVNGASGWGIYYNGTSANGGTQPSLNTWYHTALVRSGTSLKLYVNGVATITVTDSASYTGTYLTIGGYYSTSYLMAGYIDDFRITKYARYTANFTPPTTSFRLK